MKETYLTVVRIAIMQNCIQRYILCILNPRFGETFQNNIANDS